METQDCTKTGGASVTLAADQARLISPNRPMVRRPRRFLLSVAVALLAGFLVATRSAAVTFFDHLIWTSHTSTTLPLGFSDILANANDHWSWDPTAGSVITIRFTFDASFNTLFPDPRIKDQVRLALTQWDNANTVAYGTQDDYLRTTAAPAPNDFFDIRTVTVHEVGHVLGFAHPNQGFPASRNYRKVAGMGVGPLTAQANTTREVMHAFVSSGLINHILSWDEVDGFRFSYPGLNLNFVEVAPTATADLVFQSYNNPNPGNIARGVAIGTLRNPANVLDGTRVTSATICFNDNCSRRIGFRQHGINWDMTCALATHTIQIRTRGTDNLTPVGTWNNFGTPHVFAAPTHTPFGPNQKDDITHRWTNPTTDVPAGTAFHPGISLDVFDWTVVNAVAFDAALNSCVIAIVGAHDWSNDGVVGFSAGPESADGLHEATNIITRARGFVIQTSEAPVHRLSNLRLADVTGKNFQLADLNRRKLQELTQAGQIMTVTNFENRTLGPQQEFVVVFQGEQLDLPPDLRQSGNFLIMRRPDLLQREMFLAVDSSNDESSVTTFTLIGTRPIGGQGQRLRIVRSPNGIQIFWRTSAEGYVLQSSPRLASPQWRAVDVQPSTVGGEHFVILPAESNAFYRLYRP